jgi:predicted nucleotide-binding protein
MPGPLTNRSVFVVHGRNEALRRVLFEFLRSIDLAPMERSG